jgi:transcriptional regulator with XRE-family HTH domain
VDDKFRERLAEIVIQVRGEISQRDFAEQIGVSYSAIQSWEGKKHLPSFENLEKIAELRGKLPEELLAELYGRSFKADIPLEERLKIMSHDDLIDLLDKLAALLKKKNKV